MNLNQIKIEKSGILDGIEVKSATFIDKTFPLHFHKNWSLACVNFGSENISFGNSSFLLSKKAVILIPPHSIHRHWGNKDCAWGYKAIYLNSDVMKNFTKKIDIDYSYIENFPYFIDYIDNKLEVNENSIFEILKNLLQDSIKDCTYLVSKNEKAHFEDILYYLSQHYYKPITLDSLEKKFRINKFNLQKNFKRRIGLSPTEYLTAIRIENSKQLFHTGSTLSDIAIESGFYDQSHYTHSFQKFVGVTPGVYKKSVKILQD